jgi:peroxiredoxin
MSRGFASIVIGGFVTGLLLGMLTLLMSDRILPASSSKPTSIPFPINEASQDDLAPDFTVPGLDLQAVTLNEHRGHKVLLNFFASWCLPCREEMPGVQRQFEKHEVHGWIVIGVSVMESASTVIAFRDEFGLTFPIGLDLTGKVSQKYNVRGTPTDIVVDAQGFIVKQRLGYMSELELEKLFASLP